MRRCSAPVAAVAFSLAMVTALATVPTAHAQSGSVLELVDQTPFVPSEGTFEATLSWSGPLDPELTIGGLLYAPIADESEITEQPTAAFSSLPFEPIVSLPRTADGAIVFSIPIRSVEDGSSERIRIREPGVYPIQIEVRSADGTTQASLRTNMIRLPTEAAEIDVLPISTVIEISSAEGLTVAPASDILTNHPDLPLAVVLGDGVLTQLESNPDLASMLRTALGGRPVIAAPSPELDVSALASIGRPDLYVSARDTTLDRVRNLGLVASTDIIVLEQDLTIGGVDLLTDLGIAVIVDTSETQRSTGLYEGTNDDLRVVQVDSTLTGSMRGPARSVERVHRLLAALTLRSNTDRTPILLGGASFRRVPVASIQLFLRALEQPGTLVTTGLVDAASGSPLIPIRPAEQPDQNLVAVDGLIATITDDIETYRTFYVNGGLPPIVYERSLIDALAVGRNPADRARSLEQLAADLDDRFGDVALPQGQSVTLAAQRAEIPITVENTSDGDRLVLLAFESDKLDVDQDRTTVVLPPGTSTIDIELEARSLGRSPLLVQMLTPDETVVLTTTSYGVRSTAIPGLGLLLSAAALVFLISWWIVSIAKARAQRQHPANTDTESVLDVPTPAAPPDEAKLSS